MIKMITFNGARESIVTIIINILPWVCNNMSLYIWANFPLPSVPPAEAHLGDGVHFFSGFLSSPRLPSPAHLCEYRRHHGYAINAIVTSSAVTDTAVNQNPTNSDRSTKSRWQLSLPTLSVSMQTPGFILSAATYRRAIIMCLKSIQDLFFHFVWPNL